MVRKKIILSMGLPPGDVCALTAAVESLHATYPGRFVTGVRTAHDELFQHNPYVTRLSDREADVLDMHYTELIQCCDRVPNAFLRGYCHDLGRQLGVPLDLTTSRPHLYLSDAERAACPLTLSSSAAGSEAARYWLVTAGVKRDFTLKQWPVEYYQAVVDHFRGKILFVQVGAAADDHPPLAGTVNLVGRTGIRDLMRLAYFADGGLGPITLLQHLCAAFERPYVALLGGREPVSWTQYPLQTTLHTLGKLPCCRTRSCWRSRVVRLNDGWEQDDSLCESPMLGMARPVGRCMAVIRPEDVIRAIEIFYDGGALNYSVGGTEVDVAVDESFTTDREFGEANRSRDDTLPPPRPIPPAIRGMVAAGKPKAEESEILIASSEPVAPSRNCMRSRRSGGFERCLTA